MAGDISDVLLSLFIESLSHEPCCRSITLAEFGSPKQEPVSSVLRSVINEMNTKDEDNNAVMAEVRALLLSPGVHECMCTCSKSLRWNSTHTIFCVHITCTLNNYSLLITSLTVCSQVRRRSPDRSAATKPLKPLKKEDPDLNAPPSVSPPLPTAQSETAAPPSTEASAPAVTPPDQKRAEETRPALNNQTPAPDLPEKERKARSSSQV